MRISDWSSDVCSSDLYQTAPSCTHQAPPPYSWTAVRTLASPPTSSVIVPSARRRTSTERPPSPGRLSTQTRSSPSARTSMTREAEATTSSEVTGVGQDPRSEEHPSELQSLMRNSYAVFCLKKKN